MAAFVLEKNFDPLDCFNKTMTCDRQTTDHSIYCNACVLYMHHNESYVFTYQCIFTSCKHTICINYLLIDSPRGLLYEIRFCSKIVGLLPIVCD